VVPHGLQDERRRTRTKVRMRWRGGNEEEDIRETGDDEE
jgi:hypothetical protein